MATEIYKPFYLAMSELDRKAVDAKKYFVPGILEGQSMAENATYVQMTNHVYQTGLSIEGVQQFWDARAGFENQMKKVIVAADDAAFERQYQVLCTYAEENGLTDEVLKEFTEMFLEANEESLKKAGIIN
jgi:hypothetical protein